MTGGKTSLKMLMTFVILAVTCVNIQAENTSYHEELLNKILQVVQEQGNQIQDLGEKFEKTSSKVDDLKAKENYLLSVLTGQQTQLKQNQVENRGIMLTKFSEATKLACELSRTDLPTTNINGKRYFMSFYQPLMTWSNAEYFCKSHNMDLVSFESTQEWEALKHHVNKLVSKFRAYVWSAATDIEQEGSWKWASTGDHVTYYDCNFVDNHEDEDCMHMWLNGWGDYPCTGQQAFICEVNAMC